MQVSVLGVKIDALTKSEALDRLHFFMRENTQHTVWTPNPEMLVKAQRDVYFKHVLNQGDLNLCDGFGLWLGVKVKGRGTGDKEQVDRIPGVDCMLELCALAQREGKSVFLLGSGSDEVITKTAEELKKKFPKLSIAGVHKGLAVTESIFPSSPPFRGRIQQGVDTALLYDAMENNQVLQIINTAQPDILFVAFGMGKQEKWISENLSKLPSVKIAMGVGGSFDYISGKVPRAPLLMRKIGLEWLYRLWQQPTRFWRIVNATAVFSILVVISKFKNQKTK